ncbi:histidine phosphatase family protein [Ponticoccus sp. SC2-23]|uniref:SixA phosphatase family protein n=1 Tax=Alexandriicola marinus TaxID=2081710 RepID=UPI000FDA37FD|nr:histidine phosphatase family protein [Alexandriicola marinus]MBM1222070.1 histidine phosphatase family protein [Ponticoccus sp. SC6-9]MBM1226757.1 histidine phosphatase family protein [Ponticoccus sp. SC6-15]MBM1231017.1 histidine phosphatase family protein [Ponticoccus sp. SC6-38]MBM1235731.1 histidine phosphatase family protein [Ponticoccus sp. SC6-45]MBM1240039.1 histidine phosphatase family protein [Ponticoccus sp. SC6-49]MBM1244393.1 histidine phosphatase family protein [Ponticoccus s
MTLRLIIIRHAKSSWGDPTADDHDRVLNERGRISADALGDWLAAKGYVPDEALCSTASRTVETLDRISARLPARPPISYERRLYHADPGTILDVVRGGSGATLAVIGHNPGIGGFADAMTETPPDHPEFHRYPTGATTILEFDDASWQNVRPKTGRTLDFVVPRDLGA